RLVSDWSSDVCSSDLGRWQCSQSFSIACYPRRRAADQEGCPTIMKPVELEKTLLRKVGEAIHRYRMIREGDRVAVALSGGKDSATMLEALLLLQKRAPIDFSVCAFTVEQGKFLRPIAPLGEYLKARGIAWTYF